MATRTVSNSGGNWNATGTWVEGAIPTSADDVVFSTNVNCTISSAAVCKAINFGTISGWTSDTFAIDDKIEWSITSATTITKVCLKVKYNKTS